MAFNHDTGYKQLFSHREMVRDLLAGFTPFACFQGLSSRDCERVNASYISEGYSERHGDMVWRVKLGAQTLYVYLLLEFQSTAERWMALRIQVYAGLLYQDLIKRHELTPDGRLPPLLPLVLYRGAGPWHAHTNLRDLVLSAPRGLQAYQPAQRYLLIDQKAIDPASLSSSSNLVAALFRLELSEEPETLIDVLGTLRAWLRSPGQAGLRRSIASWISNLRCGELGVSAVEVEGWLGDDSMGERFPRRFATWTEALEHRGLVKGLVRGREEGEVEALRRVAHKLMALRFGSRAEPFAERLGEASAEDLDRWLVRIVDAKTPDAVFTDP